MNAVALADGWVRGGADGARQKLADFWRAVGRTGRFSPVQRSPWDVLWGNWSVENTPGYLWFDSMSRFFRPMSPIRSTSIRCAMWCAPRSISTMCAPARR